MLRLYPGEILGSGTVPLGSLMEHKRFLADDDAIEFEIEGIGVFATASLAGRGALSLGALWQRTRAAFSVFPL